jgi:hypothetical protein
LHVGFGRGREEAKGEEEETSAPREAHRHQHQDAAVMMSTPRCNEKRPHEQEGDGDSPCQGVSLSEHQADQLSFVIIGLGCAGLECAGLECAARPSEIEWRKARKRRVDVFLEIKSEYLCAPPRNLLMRYISSSSNASTEQRFLQAE